MKLKQILCISLLSFGGCFSKSTAQTSALTSSSYTDILSPVLMHTHSIEKGNFSFWSILEYDYKGYLYIYPQFGYQLNNDWKIVVSGITEKEPHERTEFTGEGGVNLNLPYGTYALLTVNTKRNFCLELGGVYEFKLFTFRWLVNTDKEWRALGSYFITDMIALSVIADNKYDIGMGLTFKF